MFFRSLDELSSGSASGDGGAADRDATGDGGVGTLDGGGPVDGGSSIDGAAAYCASLGAVDADLYRCLDFDEGGVPQAPHVNGDVTWAVEPDDASPPYALVFRVNNPTGGVEQGLLDTYTTRSVTRADMEFDVKLDFPDGAPPDDESASGIARGDVYTFVTFSRKLGRISVGEQLQPSDGGAVQNGRAHTGKDVDLHRWHHVRLACSFVDTKMSLWVDGDPVFVNDDSDFGVVADGTAFRTGINFSYGHTQPAAYHFDNVVYRASF